jgi:alkylation response protein AidB-like acyl-CoA dehydrogenase
MDFELPEEHKMIKATIRRFAEKEMEPLAKELDKSDTFPWEAIKKVAELNIFGTLIPTEYGGQGLDTLAFAVITEEFGRSGGPGMISAGLSIGGIPLLDFGTEEQKEKYLPRMARGEIIGCFSLTEPSGGSDAAAIQSKAVRDGDHYVLNGRKCFASLMEVAEIYTVFVKTDPQAGARGISAFLIEKGTPGLVFGKKEDKAAQNWIPTGDLILEGCRIPKKNSLGQEGRGLAIALHALDLGRISLAATSVGFAQKGMELAAQYAKERIVFGHPLAQMQATQFKLADMATQIEAARLLTYQACALRDQRKKFSTESAFAKLFASEMCQKVLYEAQQIFGGYGWIKEFPLERMVREARLFTIGEGTSEIQRLVIAMDVLEKY